jgi:hypothetical protein
MAAGAGSQAKQQTAAPTGWIGVLNLLATGAVAAVLGAVSAMVVGYFTFTNEGRDLDIRMVDISLAILAGERGGVDGTVDTEQSFEEYKMARLFALRALEQYSHVTIPDPEKEIWARSGKISFGDVPDAAAGDAVICTTRWFRKVCRVVPQSDNQSPPAAPQ